MLVEINLLTEKEKKNLATLIIIIGSIVLTLILAVVILLQNVGVAKEIEATKTDITNIQTTIKIEEEKLAKFTSVDAVNELEAAVKFIEKLPVSTVFAIDHLASLLPERGYLLDMNYTDTGAVTMTVQFDTNRQAAGYLKAIKGSQYVTTASLTKIETEVLDENVEEIVPRYVAAYVVELNNDEIRKTIEGGE